MSWCCWCWAPHTPPAQICPDAAGAEPPTHPLHRYVLMLPVLRPPHTPCTDMSWCCWCWAPHTPPAQICPDAAGAEPSHTPCTDMSWCCWCWAPHTPPAQICLDAAGAEPPTHPLHRYVLMLPVLRPPHTPCTDMSWCCWCWDPHTPPAQICPDAAGAEVSTLAAAFLFALLANGSLLAISCRLTISIRAIRWWPTGHV